MALVEDRPWHMEHGIDALIEFPLSGDHTNGEEWAYAGWDVNATVSDIRGRRVYPVTVDFFPVTTGDTITGTTIRLLFPEALVNTLKVGRQYRYDCLMVAPGNVVPDD